MSRLQSVDINKVKFKKILKKTGYTQQRIADIIGCSQQHISKCKWGINMFERICAVLEISPEDILLYQDQAMLINPQYAKLNKQLEEEKADKLLRCKMTNADRIRAMSNWELAEFIYNVSNGVTKISTCEEKCTECEYSDGYCIYQIGEWLISESDK